MTTEVDKYIESLERRVDEAIGDNKKLAPMLVSLHTEVRAATKSKTLNPEQEKRLGAVIERLLVEGFKMDPAVVKGE